MNDKLKKLSKHELLEIMLKQSKENDELVQEVQKQKEEILSLQAQLKDKNIKIRNAGSIAEASLQINGVFEAAQRAAQQYVDNLEELYKKELMEFRQKEEITKQKCKEMLENTEKECNQMKMTAKMESEKYWENVSNKVEVYLKSHDELSNLLDKFGKY